MNKLVLLLFRLFGWEIRNSKPSGVRKCVVVMAPHTSNWDFVIGRLAFYLMGVKGSFLIKKELFFFPLNIILKALGGIPVDRKIKNNMVKLASDLFAKSEELYLVFTPEGTRKYNPNWKKGFYYIAQQSKVPIALAYIDYPNKVGGFHGVFIPTGDVNKDIDEIKKILKVFKGKKPENGII